MSTIQPVEPIYQSIGPDELGEIALTSSTMVNAVRQHMFSPTDRKTAPSMTVTEICNLVDIPKTKFNYYLKKNPDMPQGTMRSNRLEFTAEEAQKWVHKLTPHKHRDKNIKCPATICVGNFKGGVTTTTTVWTLAQGLALRGYKILVVDLDPQGSATSLYGIVPDLDVAEGDTTLPLYQGLQNSIEYAVRSTYWPGIDLVPASPELHNAEFILPSRQILEEGFEFWRVLDQGLDEVRDKYDVILIDTPPSLSYTTVNAMMAADGLIMPMPPSPLDFASSAQFWSLCNDVFKTLTGKDKIQKRFYFIDVVLTRVDNRVGVSGLVRDWIVRSYGSKVLSTEIPRTVMADTAAAAFGTVYDVHSSDGTSGKTLKRARDAYERLVEQVEMQIQGVWAGIKIKAGGTK